MFISDNHTMSSCWQITFTPLGEIPAGFEEFLENFFEVTACNYNDNGQDEYIGYQSESFDEHKMCETAASWGLVLPPYTVSHLESSNWLKDYVIKFAPFEVDDFLIYGIHETQAPQTSKIALKIYAATAFGSDHQTTRSCLKAICELYHQGFAPQHILDIGTGSGILSLAAGKLWTQSPITAVDIDEESVWVTRQNAVDNNLANQISVTVSDGCQSAIVSQNAPYQLVLANILARPLISMAADIAQVLAPQGYCILSGFVEDQAEWVISAYQQAGLKLVKLYELDNWRAALMQKE